MKKTDIILSYLASGILLIATFLRFFFNLNTTLYAFLTGIFLGLIVVPLIRRFFFARQEAQEAKLKKEHKLKELEEYIKKHEK